MAGPVLQVFKLDVGTSADAARRSACATMTAAQLKVISLRALKSRPADVFSGVLPEPDGRRPARSVLKTGSVGFKIDGSETDLILFVMQ